MLSLLVSWFFAALALWLSSKLFRSVRLEGDFADALWVAALFSILSFLLDWLIFGFLTIASLGLALLFRFVTQLLCAAIVLKITSALSSRFDIRGFLPAVGTAVLLAIASEIAHRVAG